MADIEDYVFVKGTPPNFPGDLRDWFAGQAINGWAVSDGSKEEIAEEAYKLADVMIAEKRRREG